MSYSYVLSDSIQGTNLEAWNRVRSDEDDLFMDPRFVATVERTMAAEGRYWTLLIYDQQQRPAAAACVCLMRIDGLVLGNSLVKRLLRPVRRLWRNYLYFNVLFVGLPVSAGQSHLRIRPDAEVAEVLRTLDAALGELASRQGASVIVLKEFERREVERLDGLRARGYLRADSLPMNHFDVRHGSLTEFRAALRKQFRKSIRYSLQKYKRAGLRTVAYRGGQRDVDRLYTDAMYRLYEAVVDRASRKLEKLPAEFFRELGRQFGDQVVYFQMYQGKRIVGCACTMLSGPVFYLLFAGLDYELNAAGDLYFNLTYQQLDFGMRRQAADIHMGQTADEFRARLGCRQEPRYLYVKGRGLMAWVIRTFFKTAFPPVALTPQRAVFRQPHEQEQE